MLIHISKIKVDRESSPLQRGRSAFGELDKLAASIKAHGLLHPVVVDTLPAKVGNYEYHLIAGERRLRATLLNETEFIEATLWKEIDDYERKALELEENVQRKDLEWPEQIMMLRQLHVLRQGKFGVATDGDRGKDQGWGVRDTAKEINMAVGSCSEDLKLAATIEKRPDILEQVKHLPKTAARKMANQIIRAEELMVQVNNKSLKITTDLRLGNCLDLIDELEDRSVDMLFTDPPFGNPDIVGAANVSSSTYNFNKDNVSTIEQLNPLFKQLFPKISTKLKIGAHVYIMCGMGDSYYQTLRIATDSGMIMDEMALIWHKERVSVMAKDYHYMPSYQVIIFGHNIERKRPLMKPVPNVISIPSISPQSRVHPLQLPEGLLRLFIENSSSAGELVLDCFGGSGSTAMACKHLQRRSISFELNEGNYLRAQEWLGKE
jgi:site-specific DNA-methyltransferase (adenine-specific)